MKVLIIDDDPSIGMLLELALSAVSIEVKWVNSVSGLFQELDKSTKWDGIVVDFLLPEMDGIKVKSQIIKNYGVNQSKIVFLTASPEKIPFGHLCIPKPFSPLTIGREICDILEQDLSSPGSFDDG